MNNEMLQFIGQIYWILMFIAYPLFFRKGYADIADVKLASFYLISALFIISGSFFLLGSVYKKSTKIQHFNKTERIWTILIILFSTVSFLGNQDYEKEIIRNMNDGRIIFIITIIAIYFLLKQMDVSNDYISICAVTGSIGVAVIAIIQAAGVDFLGWYAGLVNFSSGTFMTTLGNIDSVGLYFIMLFPFSYYLFTHDNNKYVVLGAVGLLTNGLGIIVSNTDAALIGFVFEIALLFFISKRDLRMLKRFSLGLIIMAAGWFIMGCIRYTIPTVRELDTIQSIILSPMMGLLLMICFMVGYLLLRFDMAIKVFSIVTIATLILMALYPVYILIYTQIGDGSKENLLADYFYFNDKWGSGRGIIWKTAWEDYYKSGAFGILFGNGIGRIEDAHNVYLELLYRNGLLGLFSIMGFILYRLREMTSVNDTFNNCKFVAWIGFFVVGVFVISSNVTLCLIPVLL